MEHMKDHRIEEVIIVDTAAELLQRLESISDETIIGPKDNLWVGVSNFAIKTESFTDAFDYTVYEHNIYEPTDGPGEVCLHIYKKSESNHTDHRHVSTVGELKEYLKKEHISELKVVSVDDNFELGGAITERAKFLLLCKEDKLMMELR